MLKILNNLQPFFQDCYRRINVREYATLIRVSPPTASSYLLSYSKEGLLLKTAYKNNLLFSVNHDSKLFLDLSRMYWQHACRELIAYLEEHLLSPSIVLFGSLAKGEAKVDSDIDLAVFAHKRSIDLQRLEKKLRRTIQLFWFSSLNDIPSKELANNILNGYVLRGRLTL